MRRSLLLSTLAAALVLAACEDGTDILFIDEPSSTLLVETNADDGEGSLRAALETAGSDPVVNSIQVAPGLGTLALEESLEFSGSQAIRIVGNGLEIDGSGCGGCDLLIARGGGDLDLFDLTMKKGDTGFRVEVPAGRTGTVTVRLVRVTVESNSGHGVHVLEPGSGSAAGLQVELISSAVRLNGFASGKSDLDGIRVDEVGEGKLLFVARDLKATGNAGDGVDLNEGGSGDLVVDVIGSSFDTNGEQPQAVANREDGFDAWEAGPGNLDARILSTTATGNFANGVELTESEAGDLRATLTEVTASRNQGDNFQLREDVDAESGAVPGAGGIIATFSQVTAREAVDDGAQIQEFGAGDLNVQIQDGDLGANAGDGLVVQQGGTGRGRLHLVRVATSGNTGSPLLAEGTEVTEGNDQTALVRVRNASDAGFGSLRAALEAASSDQGVSQVLFEAGIGTVTISKSLEYGGTQDLLISGLGASVSGAGCNCDALLVKGSGALTVEGLSFRGASGNGIRVTGGGDLTLRNLLLEKMGANGIVLDIPATATGVVRVVLEQMSLLDNPLHGLFIDDLADTGGGGSGASSAAGILLEVENTLVRGNGFRQDVTDRDGIRVEEGGSGGIEVRMTGSSVTGNAGDGIELKEEGLGEVVVDVRQGTLDQNGAQPQNPDRPEDGLDIAEAGPGSVRLDIRGLEGATSSVRSNGRFGIAIVEQGSGDVLTTLDRVQATRNGYGALSVIEDADAEAIPTEGSGGVVASLSRVTAGEGGRDGIRLVEYGVGDVSITAWDLASSTNGGDGVWVDERGVGGVVVDARESRFDDNGRVPLDPDDLGDGFEIRESGAGTVDLRFLSSSLSRNADRGLDAEESGSGDVRAILTLVSLVNNRSDNLRLVEDLDAKDGAAPGAGNLSVAFSDLTSTGATLDAVNLAEYGEGDLTGQIVRSTLRNNGSNGVDATQAGAGVGELQLVTVTMSANGEGDTAAVGVNLTTIGP